MKKILLSFLMLCTTFAFAAPNPADYNITVHVTASRNRLGPSSLEFNFLDVIIDGKKYELRGRSLGVLAPGDYKARLKKTERWNDYDILQTYEFLMPNGKTRDYELSGIPE